MSLYPHNPSSSNTNKNHGSSPPPIGEVSNNLSLLHDDPLSPNHKKLKTTSLHDEDVPNNPSLPLDKTSLDTKKLHETSPSRATQENDYELHPHPEMASKVTMRFIVFWYFWLHVNL
jgi:hypothetical protein